MSGVPSAWFVLDVAVAGCLTAVAADGWRRRPTPGAAPFAAVCVVLATAAAATGLVRLNLVLPNGAFLWVSFAWRTATVAWLWFALEYTGRGPTVTRRGVAVGVGYVLAFPLVVVLADVAPAVASSVGSGLVIVTFALAVTGTALLARAALADGGSAVGLAVAFAGGGAATTALLSPLVFDPFPLDARLALLSVLLATAAGAFAVASGLDPFAGVPGTGHLARETVFDELTEAVVVVDRLGRVSDLNASAAATFGVSRAAALGRPADRALGVDLAAIGERDGSADRTGGPDGVGPVGDGAGTEGTESVGPVDPTVVAIDTAAGERRVEVTAAPLHGAGDALVGRAYLLRDVTERYTDEQRLAVLNRILRHNLRNDLDAVRGFAERLGDPDADRAALAGRIRDLATEVSALGDTVADAERLLSRPTLDRDPVDVVALARSVASTVADESGDASVVAPDGSVTVRTDSTVLRGVLGELVENGLEHADRPDPSVTVTVTPTGDGASLAVRDEGPGIPDRERAVLLDGEETPLKHGSGLGLWLVSWGVTRLGGQLSFEERESRGSVVRVVVPGRDASPVARRRSTAGESTANDGA